MASDQHPSLYRSLARPLLFRCDAERAHDLALGALSVLSRAAGLVPSNGDHRARAGRFPLLGTHFPSRLGLAAGLDKDGRALRAWPLLGFGFIEVGTVTAHPQPGNAAPRLFRLPADEAVVNRMGFNNAGSAALADRLQTLGPLPVPLGISIGKSKVTPVADAVEDYLTSLRRLHRYADYVAVNVSSPNTPGLRTLQDADSLRSLVDALVSTAVDLAGPTGKPVPLVVKVAPDLTESALEELVDVCLRHGVAGVIATNTTLSRAGLHTPDRRSEQAGGLSGRPLAARALQVVQAVRAQAGDRLAVIGVGGISSPDDGLRMLDAGADLVQIYTSLIYQGPAMVRRLSSALDDHTI